MACPKDSLKGEGQHWAKSIERTSWRSLEKVVSTSVAYATALLLVKHV